MQICISEWGKKAAYDLAIFASIICKDDIWGKTCEPKIYSNFLMRSSVNSIISELGAVMLSGYLLTDDVVHKNTFAA